LLPFLIGLTLNIFIESAQYVPEVSQAAGARIAIHNQGEMPFPDDDGINLVPGFSTSVGVRRVCMLIIIIKKYPHILGDNPVANSNLVHLRMPFEGFVTIKF